MLQAFVITFREGLEAFLIVAISIAYLRKSQRSELVPAVRWGIGLAVLLSIGAAVLFHRATNQALWEGVLALVAAVSVTSLTVHMWRTARLIKHDIEGQLEMSTLKTGTAAFTGVFLFTLLMITREGMETALLMGTLLFQVKALDVITGAMGGVALAAFVASLWSRYGHRVDLGLFLQVTAIFLLVFVCQLLIYGFHELMEANIFPNSGPLHIATEPYGPDGIYGHYLTYLLVLLPMAWLALAALTGRRNKIMVVAVLLSGVCLRAQTTLPPGAVSLVNRDRFGSRVALCAETGGQIIQQAARRIVPTAVWVGAGDEVRKLNAGPGACDPAWSPDGRFLALTAADGLWIFPADSSVGVLTVEAKLPVGEPTEFTYRAFARPKWSPDGILVALAVTNGGTSWVEVFEAAMGRLLYTSPPETYSFSWGATARDLKAGTLDIHLPSLPSRP